ncbi:unnamed protein product [Lota lota]
MTGMVGCLLFLTFSLSKAQEHIAHEAYPIVEKAPGSRVDAAPTNQSRGVAKEMPINEPLEKSSRMGDSKYSLHPLPADLWPKHSDLAVPMARHHGPHGPHGKARKGPRGGERHALQHNGDKARGEAAAGLLPKAALVGVPSVMVVAANHTLQNLPPDALHDGTTPHHQHHQHHTEPTESYPNSRAKGQQQPQNPPAQPDHNVPPAPRREPPPHRLDAEENRPAKSSVHQSGVGGRNASRPSLLFNRRPSSLLHQYDVLKRESDFPHDSFCLSECRKEREEREHYCYSEFAVNGIVYGMDTVRRGVRLITLMVGSDGFYKMSRLYVSPDSFFFKVRLLVLDTYRCSRPCPDLKLGSRYIVMGQIYQRRRHLPNDLLAILGGKLKPGDGLLRSNSYVKRFNKRRHQKALEATRSRCR